MVILLLTLRTTLQRVTTILSKLSSMHIITFRTESRIKCKEITIELTEYTFANYGEEENNYGMQGGPWKPT